MYPQQQMSIVDAVFQAAVGIHQREPSAVTQQAIDALSVNRWQNPVAAEMARKIDAMFAPLANMPKQTVDAFIGLTGELCIVSAATTLPAIYNNMPHDMFQRIVGIKTQLLNDIKALSGPQYGTQGSYGYGYGTQQQPDPYSGYGADYNQHGGMRGMNDHNPYEQAAYNPNTGFSHNTIPEDEYVDSLTETPAPITPTEVDVYEGTGFADDWQGFEEGLIEDVVESIDFNKFDDVINGTEEPFPTVDEVIAEDELDGTPYTRADSISDLDLSNAERTWLRLTGTIKEDGEAHGVLVIGGALLIPTSVPNAKGKTSKVNMLRKHYVEFETRLVGDEADADQNTISKNVFIQVEELPVDYETLSPRPFICQDPDVTIIEEDEVTDEETVHIVQQRVDIKDDATAQASARAIATSLIWSRTHIKKADSSKIPVGIFVDYDYIGLGVREGKLLTKEHFDTVRPTDSFDVLYAKVDEAMRPNFLKTLDIEIHELISERLGIPDVTWGTLATQWDELLKGIAGVPTLDAKEVEEEFQRALKSVMYGAGQVTTEIKDFIDTEELDVEDGFGDALVTSSRNKDLSMMLTSAKRPSAIISTWMTVDELGLTESGYLSEATNYAIATPICNLFNEFDTLTKIIVVDAYGIETNIYRGVGKSRHIVKV